MKFCWSQIWSSDGTPYRQFYVELRPFPNVLLVVALASYRFWLMRS